MSEKKAKVIHVFAKTADRFGAKFSDKDGNRFGDYDGYVPSFFPDKHYGDYLILDIDLETGHILNWSKPTDEEIEELINGDNK